MKQFFFKLTGIIFLIITLSLNNAKAQSNQYLDFDGVDDFVSITNGSAAIAASTAFSMTGWFNVNALGYGHGMMGFRASAGGFYMIELNNGQLECRMQNSAGTLFNYNTPNYTVVPQTWQHYAWVYGSNSCKLYLNGNLVGSVAASGTITNAAIPFAIGKSILSGFNFNYSGHIDEVSVWNKELSQAEIQDMMTNELTGSEPNLQMYYKFNQGVPGGNNTGITTLHTEVNSPTCDGDLLNFAMTGATSNFNGTLNPNFQSISFPAIGPKLISDPPFQLLATATSGLPVNYMIVSGPASVNGSTLTLNGTPGTVTVQADQPGNATYDSASSVINSFDVVDPSLNLPVIDARNPLPSANVYMPTLGTMELAAVVTIPYSPLFSVQSVQFVEGAQTMAAADFSNTHYTAFWTPASYGPHTITINATNNFGYASSLTVNINVVQTMTDTTVQAFSGILLDSSIPFAITDGYLPSYVGAYDTIIATLSVSCPPGGCDPWDRVSSIEARGHDGKWFEIIRYITPYGTACSHQINVADYMSLLQGKVSFRANLSTLTNGYLYQLSFNFKSGLPPHKYSKVSQVWRTVYPFGDYSNLQPVPIYNFGYPALSVASKLKLVSTGHGWGNLNTNNAAEFYDATHNIWVNGANTFSQHNWTTCNPNPDACQPQNGTWTYNRAGWCPGSIARPFDYDMTPYISGSPVSLQYKFLASYIDQCHPNNPSCVTGVTCTDCNDGFNPTLDVNCNLVTWFDDASTLSISEIEHFNFSIYPNPSNGVFNIQPGNITDKNYSITVFDVVGNTVKQLNWNGQMSTIDLSKLSKGVYTVRVSNEKETEIRKLILE